MEKLLNVRENIGNEGISMLQDCYQMCMYCTCVGMDITLQALLASELTEAFGQ